VACQAGVCYYSPELLGDKAAQTKMGDYDTLSDTNKKKVIKTIKQECLAYLFLHNSNGKMQDVANNYSKGNTDAYPTDIHKVLNLVNKYKPLKLDTQVVPAQGTAFVTGGQGGRGQRSTQRRQSGMRSALKLNQRSLSLARKARMMMRTMSPWQATSQQRPLSLSPRQ
jgi:hypothetical protein